MKIVILQMVLFIALSSGSVFAQQMIFGGSGMSQEEMKAVAISKDEKKIIVDELIWQIKESYILREEVGRIVEKLELRVNNDSYKNEEDALSFSKALTKDLREITNDAHFNILYNPNLFKRMNQMMNSRRSQQGVGNQNGQRRMSRNPSGWADGKRNNYFFKNIEILEGNVGYIKLEKIPTLTNAKATVDSAMGFLGNTDAVILDLRNNPGGFAGFISYFMSYFFPEGKTHIFTREMSMQPEPYKFYTEEKLPNKRLDKIPLYILINENTGSAATNMTYNLQKHNRAKVVGVTTEKGIMGAHSAMPFPLKNNFVATIPIGRVINAKTRTNWNNTGVVPDIPTDKDAKDVAYKTALKEINYTPKRKSSPRRVSHSTTNVKTSNVGRVRRNAGAKTSAETAKANELLSKMVGEWKIEYSMRRNPNSRFQKGIGTAKFEKLYGEGQIKEMFELGGRFKGEAFVNFASAHKRFELFQIDMMSSRRSTIYLIGDYIEKDNRLNFYAVKNHPQWGQTPSLEIRWEYIFYEDGSFKKEMYSKGEDGKFFLQSDYHYKKQ